MADIISYDHGSLIGFHPVSDLARDWINDNTASEAWQWMGPVLYIEHRLAYTLATALVAEGLELKHG